jgi:hypothetical protein
MAAIVAALAASCAPMAALAPMTALAAPMTIYVTLFVSLHMN